ncbi:MAG: lytic transglycosylase domain-containing protein [Pseudomonadota bacterium]
MKGLIIICVLLCLAAPVHAEDHRENGPDQQCSDGSFGRIGCIRSAHFVQDMCQMLRDAARRHYLDEGFLTRLIWQESRFDPNALSPTGARGIAQFTDTTAAARGLDDSFNPAESIERSARYLSHLRQENGNLGLAAMAYDAGEARAFGFMAGNVPLPQNTRDYVQIITGLSAETWRNDPPDRHDFRLSKEQPFLEACYALAQDRRLMQLTPPGHAFAPWGVQVAFGRTEKTARAQARHATESCQGLVRHDQLQLIPLRNRVAGRKGYWMARLAAADKQAAMALCTALRQQNCPCRVVQNP